MPASADCYLNRFEMKYLVDERKAQAIREFCRPFIVPDKHMDPAQPLGYMVHSLYVDSPDLMLCRATVCGERNRYKLRIRYYDLDETGPVFFETKRRVYDAIIKSRAMVNRDRAMRLIRGGAPATDDLADTNDPYEHDALGLFCELRDAVGGVPSAYTSYRREAYLGRQDDHARLTMDRELMGGDGRHHLHDVRGRQWCRPKLKGVVLELKFTQRFPLWMRQLVRTFHLQRISVPKYVECVNELKRAGGRMRPVMGAPA